MSKFVERAFTLSQSGTPPTEFRIFSRGLNATTKGTFLFDDQAAKQIMGANAPLGVDLPIDLEHLSLGGSERPDAFDARGWFRLALRNGELWAVNVRWTADGAARLANKTQRYISPAFTVGEDMRPIKLLNCALVAAPATHGAPALVAASRSGTVSARLSAEAIASIRKFAAARRSSVSDVLKGALATLTAGVATSAEIEKKIADLVADLGLPKDATPDAILDELKIFLVSPATPNPTGGVAESAPVGDLVNPVNLSADQQKQWLSARAAKRAARRPK